MRKVIAKAGVEPCPFCDNKTDFNIHSNQVCEDGCEVWAECGKCGHHTPPDYRLEDVWGGTGEDNCQAAMMCWNDYISDLNKKTINENHQSKID